MPGAPPMSWSLHLAQQASASEPGDLLGGLVCCGIIFVVLLVLGGGAKAAKPKRCTFCGNVIRRTGYIWEIEGKKHILCPHCNTQMERRKSREAMDRIFGEPPSRRGRRRSKAAEPPSDILEDPPPRPNIPPGLPSPASRARSWIIKAVAIIGALIGFAIVLALWTEWYMSQ